MSGIVVKVAVFVLFYCVITSDYALSLYGVDVIIFNAIERYASCVMVIRVGPRSMAVVGCMLVPVCIVFVFRICVYECVCMMVCVFVYWCAYVHAYVRICMCV